MSIPHAGPQKRTQQRAPSFAPKYFPLGGRRVLVQPQRGDNVAHATDRRK
jgi:hypothetical protein